MRQPIIITESRRPWRHLCVFLAALIAAGFFYLSSASAAEEMSPAAFAALYFETPVISMRGLDGTAYLAVPSMPQAGCAGYLTFECDSVPVLRDQARYKPGGDFVSLVDTFIVTFKEKAWPLLHAKDTQCLRMLEGGQYGSYRWFVYNRKTHRYFFRRAANDMVLN